MSDRRRQQVHVHIGELVLEGWPHASEADLVAALRAAVADELARHPVAATGGTRRSVASLPEVTARAGDGPSQVGAAVGRALAREVRR